MSVAYLREPLFANNVNGDCEKAGRALLTTGANNGVAPAAEKTKESADEEDRYWVDIDQPEALAEPADVESGGRRRPLLFRNKRVKRHILYIS